MKKIPVYKTEEAKERLHTLYQSNIQSLNEPARSRFVETSFGTTHLCCLGDQKNPPVLVFHGINSGAPVALESIQSLTDSFYLIGVDTPGQATPSDPIRLDPNSDEYGSWAAEVCERLGYEQCAAIGVSYGGFILRKMLEVAPERLNKAIFVVPAGVADGDHWTTFKTITWPLIRFMVSRSDKQLHRFMSGYYTDPGPSDLELQRNSLLGVHVDFTRPPKMTAEAVAHTNTPVYLMTAENDVFFPSAAVTDRFRSFIPTLKDTHELKGSKHVPSASHYPVIATKIRTWMSES